MATKLCPSCGKKVAVNAAYCIYCSARFDETVAPTQTCEIDETEQPKAAVRPWILIAVIAAVILLATGISAIFWLPPLLHSEPVQPTETTVPVTTTTRDPRRDAWLSAFTGRWVDEASVGKKDISTQGGALLFVHEIRRDLVMFDLLSYSGGEISRIASISNVISILDENTLHFVFDNDTQGHSGEGYLRFRDNEVDLEVLIDNADSLPEGEHSLAMNTVFKRIDLPTSEGVDLRSLTSLDKIKAVAGEPTEPPVTDEATKKTTYVFGGLTAIVREDGALESLTLQYEKLENKSAYCYECIDGTNDYRTVKAYFGEALHDYVEQPTDIRVLYYVFKGKDTVQFTFDAQDNLLIKILCAPEVPVTTVTDPTASAQVTDATEPTTAP